MSYCTPILAFLLLAQDKPAPADRAGKLLAELLAPSEKLPPLPTAPPGPRLLAPPRSIDAPEPPLPPHQAAPPRLAPAAEPRPVRPHALPEGLPLAYLRSDPAVPQRVALPAGERVRLAWVDVEEPVAVPKLTTRPVDATPPDDPTGAASVTAALSAALPQRTNPAPFLRLDLPDPFAHRAALPLPRPNTDDQPPPPAPARPPAYK